MIRANRHANSTGSQLHTKLAGERDITKKKLRQLRRDVTREREAERRT